MQVTNKANDPSKAVDPSKETHKAHEAKNDPSKHAMDANKADAAKESERLNQSARDFLKGLSQPSHSVQHVQDANKIENAKEAVKAEAFRRDRERMVKA